MESTFGLEIYAANRQFFAGRAKSLIIPAEDGINFWQIMTI